MNQKKSRKDYGLYLEAIDLSKGVIVNVLERVSGKPGQSDSSITSRLLQSATFIQGMELCEQAISSALYAQAGALVRQELECIAALEESRIGSRKDKKVPNVKNVPWKLNKAYGQLSMLAHTSSIVMLDEIQSIYSDSKYFVSVEPQYNYKLSRMLIGLHSALLAQLAMQLDILYLDMYDEGLSPLEFDSLQMATKILQEEGLLSQSPKDRIIHLEQNDLEMNTAIKKARQTFPKFIKKIKENESKEYDFLIKVRFVEGEVEEYMWISNLIIEGDKFHGELANHPVHARRLRFKQKVTVSFDQIVDWMIDHNGTISGAFTTAVLIEKESY